VKLLYAIVDFTFYLEGIFVLLLVAYSLEQIVLLFHTNRDTIRNTTRHTTHDTDHGGQQS
jgi:hypothetical protein